MTSAPHINRCILLAATAMSISISISIASGLTSANQLAAKAQAADQPKKEEAAKPATTATNTINDWKSKEEQAETSFIGGNYTEAEKQWQEAISLAEKDNSLNLAETLNQMTHLYIKQKRYDEARASLLKALAIREKELGKNSEKTAETQGNLALVEHKSGHDLEAEKLYKQVIETKRQAKSATSLAITLTNLANLYGEMKRLDEAKVLYLEALEIDKKAFGIDHKESAQDLFNIAAMYYQHNYNKEAIDYFKQAEAVYTKLDDAAGRVKCYHYLGLCYAEENSHAEAIDAYKKALQIHTKLKGDKHPDTYVHQLNLARSLDHTGSIEEAEKLYKEAVGAATENHRSAKIKLVECTLEYAHFLKRHNRSIEAEKMLKEILPTYETLSASDRRQLYELPRAYSDLLKELKQDSAADAMARKHLNVFGPSKSHHTNQ
jgi:tetratricopeptide (TPR) repeat protein